MITEKSSKKDTMTTLDARVALSTIIDAFLDTEWANSVIQAKLERGTISKKEASALLAIQTKKLKNLEKELLILRKRI